jgi:TPR repeat protein
MKKIVGLMIVGVATVCFADALSEGKAALEQKRYADALSAFTQSCESGNGAGCLNLGAMYENGVGTPQNKYKASTLYAQACRAKEALGCANMALSYDTP